MKNNYYEINKNLAKKQSYLDWKLTDDEIVDDDYFGSTSRTFFLRSSSSRIRYQEMLLKLYKNSFVKLNADKNKLFRYDSTINFSREHGSPRERVDEKNLILNFDCTLEFFNLFDDLEISPKLFLTFKAEIPRDIRDKSFKIGELCYISNSLPKTTTKFINGFYRTNDVEYKINGETLHYGEAKDFFENVCSDILNESDFFKSVFICKREILI